MTIESAALLGSFAAIEVGLRVFGWRAIGGIWGGLAVTRYSALGAVGAVGVIAVSFADTVALFGEPTPARMAAGALLCVLALVVRYELLVVRLLAQRFGWHWELGIWVRHALRMRHPRYLGLIAELAGFAAIVGSPLGFATAVVVMPSLLKLAIEQEERSVMAKYPRSGLDFERKELTALRPPIGTAALLVAAPGLVYLSVAFVTGEINLFQSGPDTARMLVLSAAGAQGTWAILALSLTLVLMQVIASSYSASLAQLAGLRWPLLAALGFLAGSMLYDVILVARLDQWVVGHPQRSAALVDTALLWAGLALIVVGLAAFASARDVAPERLATRLLEGFDAEWLHSVGRQWPAPFGPRQLDVQDPARALEGVLRPLAARGDVASMRIILSQLTERLNRIVPAGHWVAVDAYLHFFMGPLVRVVGKQMDEEALSEWLGIAELIGQHLRGEPGTLSLGRLGDPFQAPPGDALLREVVAAALNNCYGSVASRGLGLVEARAKAMLTSLPAERETMLYNPDPAPYRQLSEEDRRGLYDNDMAISILEFGYIEFLGDATATGIKAGLRDVGWSGSYSLCNFVSSACSDVKDRPRIRSVIVRLSLANLWKIARASCDSGVMGAVSLSGLHYAVDKLSAEEKEDANLIAELARQTATIVRLLARHGLLDFMAVVDTALVGLHSGERVPTTALAVIDAMDEALELLPQSPGFSGNEEAALAMDELRQRIPQVAFGARGEGADGVRRRAEEILTRHKDKSRKDTPGDSS